MINNMQLVSKKKVTHEIKNNKIEIFEILKIKIEKLNTSVAFSQC